MRPYLLEKRTFCWWRHETMGNIYYIKLNFLNLKCYVFKMFLLNFNMIEWKMEKRQLFQNRLFLALLYSPEKRWCHSDVSVDLIRIFLSEIVHPISK